MASDRLVSVTLRARAEGFIAAMGKSKAAVDDLSGATQTLGKSDRAFSTAGKAILAVGAAATAAMGMAVKASAGFEKSMAVVASTGEDAKQNLGALRDAAIDAGKQTRYSAGEAADGITQLIKAGVSAKDVLGGGLRGALDLAAAGEIAVADAAETAATAMTQFKLSGKDIPKIADLLAAGANKAMGGVGDLAFALRQSGLVAAQFGLKVDETVGTLAAFASAGLLGSDAGTSFKTMLLKLANPAEKTAKAMDELGIAAYDSSGKFVGITNLAGQLKEKLSGLTQEQRDATLATIFGTDAIRAANVLYEQGAEGIQGWIEAVNEQGYASKVAADVLNSLSGDLTILQGSFDTMMIKLGEGAQGPLRWVVQSLTDLVNLISDHATIAGWVLTLGAGFAAITAGAVGVYKVTTAIAAMKAAMDALGWSLATVGKGVGVFALVSAAIGGLIGLLSILGQRTRDVNSASEEYISTLDEQTHAITENTRATAADRLEKAGALEIAKQFGLAYSEVTDAALGQAGALDRVKAAIDSTRAATHQKIDALYQEKNSIEAVQQAYNLGAEAGEKAAAAHGLVGQSLADLGARHLEIQGEIDTHTKSIEDQIQAANALTGQLGVEKDALDQATESAKRKAEAAKETVGATQQSTDAAKEQAAAIEAATKAKQEEVLATDDLIRATQALGYAQLALSGSQIAVERSMDALEARAKESNKTFKKGADVLDLQTEAGRKNMEAIDSAAAAAMKYIENLSKQGKTAEEVAAETNRLRDEFYQAQIQMGVNADKARELTDTYFKIPGEIKTETILNYFKTQQEAEAFKKKLDALSETQRAEVIAALDKGGVAAAEAALNRVARSRTAHVKVTMNGVGPLGAGMRPYATFAAGGVVRGPGTSTSDSIPAMLSNGEYVLRAAAVDRIGVETLHQLNRWGKLPRYATGGLVGSRVTSRVSTTYQSGGDIHVGPLTVVAQGATADEIAAGLVGSLEREIRACGLGRRS